MRILLTGVSGQVGHELSRELVSVGEIFAVDRSHMDLSDLASVRSTIRDISPDLIINPAAYTAVDRAEQEPELAMRINAEAPAVMAEEAKHIGAALIHYSTDYVFDGEKGDAYQEEDVPNPQNIYGSSKLAGEQAIQSSGVPHLILRTSWVYGLYGKNFLLTMQRLAAERSELRVVADQIGAPTWSRTLAQATVVALNKIDALGNRAEAWKALSGLYHLTAQGSTSWYGFAKEIIAHSPMAQKPSVHPITTQEYPVPAKRPHNSRLACERFIQTFGSLPQWDDALRQCLKEQTSQ